MASYRRKQILLKKEDGTPAGFLRMERLDNRCDVEVQLDAADTELTALLLDHDQILPLGKISRNRTIHAPGIDEMYRYSCAAVLSRDTLLFVGGEGADFTGIQKAIERRERAARDKKAVSIAHDRDDPKRRATAPALPSDSFQVQPEAAARADEASPQARDSGDAGSPPVQPIQPKEGWTFAPCHMGALSCYWGYLTRDGRTVAKMYALAGAYDPEPPPGLSGFVWDCGYWVKVAEARMKRMEGM